MIDAMRSSSTENSSNEQKELETLAPIILFAYNRPEHTRKTLTALSENALAKESDLIVYIDGPRSIDDKDSVDEVHRVCESTGCFQTVSIIRRNKNWGLSRNIINGVTDVVHKHGKVIVLEDDIVTSPYFLQFMNEALDRCHPQKRIWHIGGWNYPIDLSGLPETFLWRVMNCWGWATWSDRWENFDKDPGRLIRTWSSSQIKRFNVDGAHNFWSQVLNNHNGKLDTWAIFWYATIFENDGLCLNPTQSLVKNIGHDGSGVHCGKEYAFSIEDIRSSPVGVYPDEQDESIEVVNRIKRRMLEVRGSIFSRVRRRIKLAASRIIDAKRHENN